MALSVLLEDKRSIGAGDIPRSVTDLTLFHCDLNSFAVFNELPELESLRLICCKTPEQLELASPTLRRLEVNFSTVTSVVESAHLQLSSLRMFGLPLDEQSRSALQSFKIRIIEMSPEGEWKLARSLWERGARACFGGIPGLATVIVRPGAAGPAQRFAILRSYKLGTEPPTDTEALLGRGYFESSLSIDGIDRFRCTWETGNRDDALRWLEASSLSEDDRTCVRKVIERFSTKRFYRAYPEGLDLVERAQKTKIPAKLRSFFTTVLQSVGTPLRSWRACLDGYDRDYLGRGSRAWHYIGTVGYMNSDSKELLEPTSVYCVGERIFEQGSGEQSSLAMSHHESEDAIYEFRDMDLFDDRRRGQLNPRLYAVFRSWASLLSHVVEIDNP